MRTPVAVVALLSMLAVLACGEAAEPPEPQDNDALYKAAVGEAEELDEAAEQQAITDFRKVWTKHQPVFRNEFLGIPTLQNPLDAWIVQEILSEVKPEFMIETGTYLGGSAALWAMILENLGPEGRVITIDIEDQRDPRAVALPISQRRVDFLLGSSTAPEIVDEVKRRVAGRSVVVLLDSLHSKAHVAAELAAYAPLVPVGSYLIVQDSPVGGVHAVDEFLAANPDWLADRSKERFRITNTIRGYLRRVR